MTSAPKTRWEIRKIVDSVQGRLLFDRFEGCRRDPKYYASTLEPDARELFEAELRDPEYLAIIESVEHRGRRHREVVRLMS